MEVPSKPSPELERKLSPQALACLRGLAARYVWWKTAEEAMRFPDRVAAQVMNMGDWDDVLELIDAAGEDYLREVVRHAGVGQLSERSWHYWHYRLGLAEGLLCYEQRLSGRLWQSEAFSHLS